MINDFVIAKQVKLLNLLRVCCYPCFEMICGEFGLLIFIGSMQNSLLLSLTRTSTTERLKMILNDLYRSFIYAVLPSPRRARRKFQGFVERGTLESVFIFFRCCLLSIVSKESKHLKGVDTHASPSECRRSKA